MPPTLHPSSHSEQNLTSSGNLSLYVIVVKMCLDVSCGSDLRFKGDVSDHGTKKYDVF